MNLFSVFYNNPDFYPPIINSATLLCGIFNTSFLFTRDQDFAVLPLNAVSYPPSVDILRMRLPSVPNVLKYALFVAKAARFNRFRPDFVMAHDAHALLPAWLLAKRSGSPLAYHCHDYMDDSEVVTGSQRLFKALERKIAPAADVVIIPDAERAAVMIQQLGLTREPIIAANAPLSDAPRSTVLQDSLRSQGKDFSKIVFRQGRIGPNHALEATIRSMPLWADPSWGFVIMGSADAAYREHLLQFAAELGVSQQLAILPAVAYPDVASFTVGATLGHGLYDPTHFNHRFFTTASNKIMEYIAAGLPVLLSESTGSQALLSRYRIGLTADEKSPESIASAINAMLGGPEQMVSMQAESKRAFEEEFNYRQQYAPVIERFQQLTARSTPAPGQGS